MAPGDSWTPEVADTLEPAYLDNRSLGHIRVMTVINKRRSVFSGDYYDQREPMLIIPKVDIKETRLHQRLKVEGAREEGTEILPIFFKEECTKYSSVSLRRLCVLSVSLPGLTHGKNTPQPRLEPPAKYRRGLGVGSLTGRCPARSSTLEDQPRTHVQNMDKMLSSGSEILIFGGLSITFKNQFQSRFKATVISLN